MFLLTVIGSLNANSYDSCIPYKKLFPSFLLNNLFYSASDLDSIISDSNKKFFSRERVVVQRNDYDTSIIVIDKRGLIELNFWEEEKRFEASPNKTVLKYDKGKYPIQIKSNTGFILEIRRDLYDRILEIQVFNNQKLIKTISLIYGLHGVDSEMCNNQVQITHHYELKQDTLFEIIKSNFISIERRYLSDKLYSLKLANKKLGFILNRNFNNDNYMQSYTDINGVKYYEELIIINNQGIDNLFNINSNEASKLKRIRLMIYNERKIIYEILVLDDKVSVTEYIYKNKSSRKRENKFPLWY